MWHIVPCKLHQSSSTTYMSTDMRERLLLQTRFGQRSSRKMHSAELMSSSSLKTLGNSYLFFPEVQKVLNRIEVWGSAGQSIRTVF
ncbi:hypothetical protein CEXT_109721 [Caerostris extrusa]|uniref:Uncharacterized protein n=1 Tax=Caerostris extrusa TaxID=172846 RepID=A0AAV4MAM9_CAEEX|nr:hypothetical protein CEXT_109721 [Caerostris extrusa]